MSHARTIILLFLIGGGTGGCAAIPLATAGSLLGFAGTAASAGSDVYNLGKLDFSVMATFDETRSATVDTMNDLQMHIGDCKLINKRDDELLMDVEDDHKKVIEVRIDRRAGRLCQCRVDVGIFGSEPTAKLIMDRMRSHLTEGGRQRAVAAGIGENVVGSRQ